MSQASITLYKDRDLKGTNTTLGGSAPNLSELPGVGTTFNDTVSSLQVKRGTWRLYADRRFKGDAYLVSANGGPNGDGRYYTASSWGGRDNSISSIALIEADQEAPAPVLIPGSLVLYKDRYLQGTAVTVAASVIDLSSTPGTDSTFNDTVSSLHVRQGQWRLFEDRRFAGRSWVVSARGGPAGDGRYFRPEQWGGSDNALSSVQIFAAEEPAEAGAPLDGAIVLCKDRDLQGTSTLLRTSVWNLSEPGVEHTFNDTVSSIRVLRGVWQIYAEKGYAGQSWTVSASGGPNRDGCYNRESHWGGADNQLSSIQLIGEVASTTPVMRVFKDRDLKGTELTITGTVGNLSHPPNASTTFNETISSLEVLSGTWRIYTEKDFKGEVFTVTADGGPKRDGRYLRAEDWGGRDNAVSSVLSVERAQWMSGLAGRLDDVPLNDLLMPGCHDAATAGLTVGSPFSPDLSGYLNLIYGLGLSSLLVKKLFVDWGKAQGERIISQLASGVRYLDLRVCRLEDTLYLCHGLASYTFDVVLAEVKAFLDENPREVVILDLGSFDALRTSDHVDLIRTLHTSFGAKLAPRTATPKVSLAALWEAGQQVIVLYRAGDAEVNALRDADPALWPRESSIQSSWKDKQDVDALQQALDEEVKQKPPDRFWVIQGVCTPNGANFAKGIFAPPRSLEDLAKKSNAMVVERTRNAWRGDGLNIVETDWTQRYDVANQLLATYDRWHGALALAPGYRSYGGSWGEARFQRHGDAVEVIGLVRTSNAAWGKIGTLPDGMRPSGRLIFNLNSHENTTRVDVLPDGSIVWVAGEIKHNWLSLAGIRFSVGSGQALPLSPGYQAYGKGYSAPTMSQQGGLVTVSGLVRFSGSWGVIGTLPEGMRPAKTLVFNLNNHTQTVRVDVRPSGQILWVAGEVQHGWLSLSGLTFAVEEGEALPLGGGVVGYGGAYGGPAIRRAGTRVVLSGLVKRRGAWPANALLATLPEGRRPQQPLVFNLNNNAATARVDVYPDGRILRVAGDPGCAWVSLSGLVFDLV